MQPHSISALAVAKHVFAQHYGQKLPSAAEIKIDWQTTEGKTKSIFHYVSKIEDSRRDNNGYITVLDVTVKTSDGSSCTLNIRRVTNGEFKQGERLIVTHSVNHISGLEEHYELSRKAIRGFHRNSWKYGDFSCTDANESSFILRCKVRVGSTQNFKEVPYKVTTKIIE